MICVQLPSPKKGMRRKRVNLYRTAAASASNGGTKELQMVFESFIIFFFPIIFHDFSLDLQGCIYSPRPAFRLTFLLRTFYIDMIFCRICQGLVVTHSFTGYIILITYVYMRMFKSPT